MCVLVGCVLEVEASIGDLSYSTRITETGTPRAAVVDFSFFVNDFVSSHPAPSFNFLSTYHHDQDYRHQHYHRPYGSDNTNHGPTKKKLTLSVSQGAYLLIGRPSLMDS